MINIPIFAKFIGAFLFVVISDIFWGFYIRKVAKGEAIKASLFSVGINFLTSVLTISYVEDKRLLVPILFGAFIGTFISVKIDKKDSGCGQNDENSQTS